MLQKYQEILQCIQTTLPCSRHCIHKANTASVLFVSLPVMSMGSRAKASSSLGTSVVCSVWSVVLGRASTGHESGLSGAPAADGNITIRYLHD